MKTRICRSVLPLLSTALALFLLSCDGSGDGNPVAPAQVDHYGHVEGYVTFNGKPVDSVRIYTYNFATSSSQGLAKRTTQPLEVKDSMGYYNLTLLEGTYSISFQKQMIGRTVHVEKFVTVVKGETDTLNVELNEIVDTLKIVPTGPKSVVISWTSFANYYQVFRSKDSILWAFVPGTQLVSNGKKVYTSQYQSAYDTVQDYGTYYYKVSGFTANDSFVSQATIKKYKIEDTPPIVKSASFADSLKYLYCLIQLNTGYTDYSRYCVVALRNVPPSQVFSPYDTLPAKKLHVDNTGMYQVILRDSVCDTGFYAFRFYTYDLVTNKVSDTSNVFTFQYKKTLPPAILSITDNMMFVQLNIQRNYNLPLEPFQVLRAKRDTTTAIAIDTIVLNQGTTIYQDYKAEADTYYYAVKQICATGINCPASKFTGIIHSTTPAAPSLYSPIDSGTYLRFQISTNTPSFPIVVYRASGKDTIPIDTLVPQQTTNFLFRDYPPAPGLYSYAIAHIGLRSEVGEKSPWIAILFKNIPSMPSLIVSQINGTTVNCRISNINNISGIILKRSESVSGKVQKIDTIYTSEFNNFELTTTNPQTLIYPDTLSIQGAYDYTVNTFNIYGNLSKDAVGAVYFPAQLPTPASPVVTTSSHYISISAPSNVTSTNADSISFYRTKDSLNGFILVRTIPVSWSSVFYDSIFTLGSGRYYYKIKIVKDGIFSDFSAPVEAYYSGLLVTPENVRVGADSTTVKITIPAYSSIMDSLILYRSLNGSSNLVAVKKFDSTIRTSQIFIDSVKQIGIFTYKTKAYHKNLVSLYSAVKSISVPGNGYQVFISPTKGDTVKVGSSRQIKWNPKNVDAGYVQVLLYKGNDKVQDISNVTTSNATDNLSWNVSSTLTPGDNYYIKMIDYYSDDLIENSETFTIAAQ